MRYNSSNGESFYQKVELILKIILDIKEKLYLYYKESEKYVLLSNISKALYFFSYIYDFKSKKEKIHLSQFQNISQFIMECLTIKDEKIQMQIQ